MITIGIDRAAKNGDWTTECVCEHLPDGKIMVKNIHRYRQTIDIKLEKQNDVRDGEIVL